MDKELTNTKIMFTVSEIIFDIINTCYAGDDIVHVRNYFILLGKWYLNPQKSKKDIVLFRIYSTNCLI